MQLDGWAIESRIYAEDPTRNFLPSAGRLTRYRPPLETTQHGVTVRNDTGVGEGAEISVFYDPMIAKLVTHAPTRALAIAAHADALDAFVIDGIRHNIPFLAALMQHERWRAGNLSTGFIAEEFPGGFEPLVPDDDQAQTLSAVAAAIDHVLGERKRQISGHVSGRVGRGRVGRGNMGRESMVTRERTRVVRLGDREIVLAIERRPDGLTVSFEGGNDKPRAVSSFWKPGDPVWSGTHDGAAIAVQVRPVLNGFALSHRGVEIHAFVNTVLEAAAAHLMPPKSVSDNGKSVRCPMPGLVVSIAVTAGQEVKIGEALAVVEAMKMENVLRAERDGVVKTIKAKPGDSLAVDDVIMLFA